MDPVSIATTLIGLKQQRIAMAAQVAVMKTEQRQQQDLVAMVAAATENLGRVLDRTV